MIKFTIIANVSIGGIANRATKEFPSQEEADKWILENMREYGGFPTVVYGLPDGYSVTPILE